MIHCHTISDLQAQISRAVAAGNKIGFVPTMGALHAGHISLVEQSVQNHNFTVVSIFVNPTQFNNPADFDKYPITLDADCKMLEVAGTDLLFLPSVQEMYPVPDTRLFEFDGLDRIMEGKFRPGHFNGVAQIVSKLFDAVQPDIAYFGQKDFQQLAIIRHMAQHQNYMIEIVACPIIREADGLAMSSRNMRLTASQRKKAVLLSQALLLAKKLADQGEKLSRIKQFVQNLFIGDPEYQFEYFEVVDTNSLQLLEDLSQSDDRTACIAVHVGEIRLIDNHPEF